MLRTPNQTYKQFCCAGLGFLALQMAQIILRLAVSVSFAFQQRLETAFAQASTCEVMLMKARRLGTLNQSSLR
jgi:hypothetical protein